MLKGANRSEESTGNKGVVLLVADWSLVITMVRQIGPDGQVSDPHPVLPEEIEQLELVGYDQPGEPIKVIVSGFGIALFEEVTDAVRHGRKLLFKAMRNDLAELVVS